MYKKPVILLALCIILASPWSFTQSSTTAVPGFITYQGRLSKSGGEAVNASSLRMVVRKYIRSLLTTVVINWAYAATGHPGEPCYPDGTCIGGSHCNMGSSLFSVGDLKDSISLAVKLRDASDSLSLYLQERFSLETQQLLSEYDESGSPSKPLQNALIQELNQLLQGPSLYDEDRFAHVTLSQETDQLIEQNPEGEDLIGLNRLLLEEAYPHEIARSRNMGVCGPEDSCICNAVSDASHIDVTELGAVGDGIANDTQAIRDGIYCLDDNKPNAQLYFPSSPYGYSVTSTIEVNKTIGIYGNGATILFDFPTSYYAEDSDVYEWDLFRVKAQNVRIGFLRISGENLPNADDGVTHNFYAIKVNNADKVMIHSCNFEYLHAEDSWNIANNMVTHGIYFATSDNSMVFDCDFDLVAGAAIFVANSKNICLDYNDINNTGWYSINVDRACSDIYIRNNSITGDDPGIRYYGGSINIMSQVHITDSYPPNKNIFIENNYISGIHSYTSVIRVLSTTNATITGNYIEEVRRSDDEDPSPEPSYYILVDTRWGKPGGGTEWRHNGPSRHVTVRDNTLIAGDKRNVGILIRNWGPSGLSSDEYAEYAEDIVVENNIIESIDTADRYFSHPIFVHGHRGGVRDVTIRGNNVQGRWGIGNNLGGYGLIGAVAYAERELTNVSIEDNVISRILEGDFQSDPPYNHDRGLYIGQYCNDIAIEGNDISNEFMGINITSLAGNNIPEASALESPVNSFTNCTYDVYDQRPSSDMDLLAGWSMISLPINPTDKRLKTLFPEAVVAYGYKTGTGYVRVKPDEELEVGKGYWILLDKEKTYTLTGSLIPSYTHPVSADGWAMIGGCTSSAKASVKNGTIGVIYGYEQGVGYQRVLYSESLTPGRGYWILFKDVIGQCNLTVQSIGP